MEDTKIQKYLLQFIVIKVFFSNMYISPVTGGMQ